MQESNEKSIQRLWKRRMALTLIAITAFAAIASSSSQPCQFPDIASCETLDGDDCMIGPVQGLIALDNCRTAQVYSCYGQDSRCSLASGQCNVWAVFDVVICDVHCERTNGFRSYIGWCGVSIDGGSGRTLNQKCSGGPCDPTQPADPIPNLIPPIPPNPPSSQGLDWPGIANYLVNPGGGGD